MVDNSINWAFGKIKGSCNHLYLEILTFMVYYNLIKCGTHVLGFSLILLINLECKLQDIITKKVAYKIHPIFILF